MTEKTQPTKLGAPKLVAGLDTENTNIKLDVARKDRLKKAAAELGLTMSDIARTAIDQWLEAYEKISKSS